MGANVCGIYISIQVILMLVWQEYTSEEGKKKIVRVMNMCYLCHIACVYFGMHIVLSI